MARWIAEEDLSLDVCSEGELVVASAAGFPAGRILLHGNGKTPQERPRCTAAVTTWSGSAPLAPATRNP
jgi:diaminopimelate decarboxylase